MESLLSNPGFYWRLAMYVSLGLATGRALFTAASFASGKSEFPTILKARANLVSWLVRIGSLFAFFFVLTALKLDRVDVGAVTDFERFSIVVVTLFGILNYWLMRRKRKSK